MCPFEDMFKGFLHYAICDSGGIEDGLCVCVCVCVCVWVAQSCLTLCDPWTVAHQAPLSMGFSRQEHWSGLPCPSPGIFPTQGSNLSLLHCRQILHHQSVSPGKPYSPNESLLISLPGWPRADKDDTGPWNFKNLNHRTENPKSVQSLGREDPLEKAMAPHSSTLAWKIPWMEPNRLEYMGSQRVGHDWVTSLTFFLSFLELGKGGMKELEKIIILYSYPVITTRTWYKSVSSFISQTQIRSWHLYFRISLLLIYF